MSGHSPRDLIGYGERPPHPGWPSDARLAVQFVINYEEGAERSMLDGDACSESFLTETPGHTPPPGARDVNTESVYEYGSRAGFWRLHRLFHGRGLPVTVFGVALALERHPEAVAAMRDADWEIACHGYRWIDYLTVPEEEERADLARAIETHTLAVGVRPLGFYCGRASANTRRLIVEEGGFLYDSDSYADDLPYWVRSNTRQHLVIPYTLDNNDMRFATPQGFNSGDQFFAYLRDAFDVLYAEGADSPRMMSVGLHCRLSGRPGRTAAVERFLDHVASRDRVWVCRRIDIAHHWRKRGQL